MSEPKMKPLSATRLARLTSDAPAATVYIKIPVDMPGVAEAGDLVHCQAEIDDDGDLVLSAFGSAAFDPLPMRPWPLPPAAPSGGKSAVSPR